MSYLNETPDEMADKFFSSVPHKTKKISQISDTERLNFLLKYFCIDDIGDGDEIPGVCIDNENLEDILTWSPDDGTINVETFQDDLRAVIDRAIKKDRSWKEGI